MIRPGWPPQEQSIFEASLMRYRRIMVTTMAALFGGLPLAFGTGAGSELRRPLGIAIVGGLLLSQFPTLYTTPVIYIYLSKFVGFFRSGKKPNRPHRTAINPERRRFVRRNERSVGVPSVSSPLGPPLRNTDDD